jgi:DNA-directed RNA polymerase specialized sigma24 family protein
MLMTYTSPEFPVAAEGAEHINVPVDCRHLEPDGKSREEQENTFELRFSRSRRLLYFIARRILTCVQEAEQAVKNCRLTASRNPPQFSSEGAFKGWLVRILIDEATVLLRKRQNNPADFSKPVPERLP